MSKRPPPGTCIHCGNHSEEMEGDHIFPKAWYPDTTPPNLEKWKAPACPTCNRAYGELENDLLVRFGLGLDPRDPDSKAIIEKAMRAVDPNGYDLKVLFLLPEHQEPFLSIIVHSGLSRHRGPGLIIGRAKSIE